MMLKSRIALVGGFLLLAVACSDGNGGSAMPGTGGISSTGNVDAPMVVDNSDGGPVIVRGRGGKTTGDDLDGGVTNPVDAAECVEAEKRCKDLAPETCTGGRWIAGKTCDFACTDGACSGECKDMATQCTGKVPQSCVSNQWKNAPACEFACLNGQCNGVCTNGDKQCTGLAPQTCVNNQWRTDTTCAYQCTKGDCTGVCTNDERTCSNATPQLCVNHQWQNQTACAFSCMKGSCTGVCDNSAKQCNGKRPQTCTNNNWQDDANVCPFVCQGGSCAGVCTPGSVQCGARGVETCSALAQWQPTTDCPYACQNGQCMGECTNGVRRCFGGVQPQLCAANAWVNAQPVIRDLIVNGNFDAGPGTDGHPVGWSEVTNESTLLYNDGLLAPSPPYIIFMGFNNNIREYLRQTVTVPANTLTLTFGYSIRVYTEEPGTTQKRDFLRPKVGTTSITPPDSNVDASDIYESWVVDIVGYRGETIPVEFFAETNASYRTDFYIDDVFLEATLCE
jgi:hypothetical protein